MCVCVCIHTYTYTYVKFVCIMRTNKGKVQPFIYECPASRTIAGVLPFSSFWFRLCLRCKTQKNGEKSKGERSWCVQFAHLRGKSMCVTGWRSWCCYTSRQKCAIPDDITEPRQALAGPNVYETVYHVIFIICMYKISLAVLCSNRMYTRWVHVRMTCSVHVFKLCANQWWSKW